MNDVKFEFSFSLKNIREHRESMGISQNELSRRTQVAQGVISDLESGFRNLTPRLALPLSNALKTNILGLCMGQEMWQKGIALKDRERLVKNIATSDAKEFKELLGAYKSMDRVKSLDFGDRDAFGRKIYPDELEARKRIRETGKGVDYGGKIERDSFGRRRSKRETESNKRRRAEKRAKKSREKAFDFGDRDSFGRKLTEKQTAEKTRIADKSFDDLDDLGDKKLVDLMEGTEDEKFLAKLNLLLKKGEERRED